MEPIRALSPLKKYKAQIILAPFFKGVEVVFELLIPILVKSIVDYLSSDQPALFTGQLYFSDPQPLLSILYPCLLMMGFALCGFSVTMITQYLAAKVASQYSYEIKQIIYQHINELSSKQLSDFGENKVLTILNSDSFALQTGVNLFMRLVVRAPILLLGSIIASFIVSPTGGIVVLVCLLLSALVVYFVAKTTPRLYKDIAEELDNISTLGDDSLSGARVIRAFNKQEEEQKKFNASSEAYLQKSIRLSKVSSWLNPLNLAFANLGVILVIYFSGFHPASGISVGSVVAIISYLSQAVIALAQFANLMNSLAKSLASKKRIDDFLEIQPDIVDGSIKEAVIEKGKNIYEFQDVCLSYGGESLALNHLNFSIQEGERIGIIGGTGSGKSSILALLERFYDAKSGKILYLGKPIQDYCLSSIRENIALVSQKPQLYKGSIRSNICIENRKYDEQEIEEALKDSLAIEFVSSFKEGLEHPVEEMGVNLSGGQKQRLLIARALLSHRKLLILDDATSALDYQSDLQVRQNIKKRHLTSILVSQRATSIHDCDRIYVLDKGSIVGVGKHETLLKDCPIYREIYETQVSVK